MIYVRAAFFGAARMLGILVAVSSIFMVPIAFGLAAYWGAHTLGLNDNFSTAFGVIGAVAGIGAWGGVIEEITS